MAKAAPHTSKGPDRSSKNPFSPALKVLFWLALVAEGLNAAGPEKWVPARWEGGPLEVALRMKDKAVAENASIRQVIAGWYDPATLKLLEGTPINCLLVTFFAPVEPEVETQQQQLVKDYTRLARERGIAVMGLVYPGADPQAVASSAIESGLDGLVLDGGFAPEDEFASKLGAALTFKKNTLLVIPIARDVSPLRTSKASLLAVQGVRPDARDLADMGIRAGPSAEPWIDSNIWLVRSFRLQPAWRPVWVDQRPDSSSPADYLRCVADSAVGGGRWIVALDDDLRAGLLRKEARALATWHSMGNYLEFAEDHAEWRNFTPYGNLGIILDNASRKTEYSEEYLNLVARRQVPYRLIDRSQLSPALLADFKAVLAVNLAPPGETERRMLSTFAENGGLVIAGPSWGDPPKDDIYAEIPLEKGRLVVYKDEPPDPETVARDMLDLLEPEVMGLSAFNVPSVLTYASTSDSGKRALIQLLNYATTPFNSKITLRFNGKYKNACLYTPENTPLELEARAAASGRTEITIPRLAVWGALLLE